MSEESIEELNEIDEAPAADAPEVLKTGKVMGKKSVLLERDAEVMQDAELEQLKLQLQTAKDEASENYDKYLRALAELDNVKKRSVKERSELLKYQGERVFIDLLEVVDDFERALQHIDGETSQVKSGLQLILKRFTDCLNKWDVRGESAIGKMFNPNIYNALSRVAAPGKAAGEIIGELKKAYYYKDKLIRHGDVVVAEGDQDTENNDKNEVQ